MKEPAAEAAKSLVGSDQLQQAVAAMINKSIAAFDAGADFLAEQIPGVLHQLLMWHAIYSFILFVVGMILIVVWAIAEYKFFRMARAHDKAYKSDLDGAVVLFWGIIGCIPRVIALLVVAHTLNIEWLQIWIAPKAWLIEYAANLIK